MKIYLGMKPGYKNANYIFPFSKNIVSFFDEKKIDYTFNPLTKVDIALCIQWEPSLKIVKILKMRGAKIVHRLDGRAKSLIKIYDKDEENRKINNLADWTVFQSSYVKEHTSKSIKTIFGVESPICNNLEKSSIIYNGVNRNIFNEKGETIKLKGKYNILHVSFTAGTRKGVRYVINMAGLLRKNPDFHFYLIGRQKQDILDGHLLKKFSNITTLDVIYDQELLAKYMRSGHVLLFPSKNDYCPNTALEAMSCGLPIIYHDSGGTPELICGDNHKAGIAYMKKNPIYPLYTIIENYNEFKDNAINNIKERFTLDIMGNNYLNLFKSLLSKKPV